MIGIQFLTNEKGKKTGVLLDLNVYGELWEDFYDNVIAKQRRKEPRESMDSVRQRLRKQGKLD